MRGFFGGVIFGLIVVAGGAAVLSLIAPPPPRPDVTADAPLAASGTATGSDSSEVDAAGRDADLVEAAPAAPGAPAAATDGLAAMDTADTVPAEKPKVGAATDGLAGPSAPGGVDVTAAPVDAPVAPQPPARTPQAPPTETALAVVPDQPAQPDAPEMAETGSGFGDTTAMEAAPQVTTRIEPGPDVSDPAAPSAGLGPEATPSPSTETAAAPDTADPPEPVAVPQATALPGTGVVTDAAPDQPLPATTTQPEPGAPPAADTVPAPATAATPTTGPAPRIAVLPQTGTGDAPIGPGVGEPVVPLTERDTAPAAATSAAPARPPIEAFAVPFDNPEGKPMLSIVLIDDDRSLGVEALSELGFPVTAAIDATAPDAAEKMARHRAAGREVVALLDLPAAATAQDAEVSLAVWLATLSESVAILEGPGSGLQGSRPLSDQVTSIALGSGLGLILRDNGLNTAQKLAAREGVPAGVVFRDFDGAGQTSAVMRRFLDQAAFRAGQQGAVIMLGRVRPDTISALALWGLQDRAARVALAPVSAVLTGTAAQ